MVRRRSVPILIWLLAITPATALGADQGNGTRSVLRWGGGASSQFVFGESIAMGLGAGADVLYAVKVLDGWSVGPQLTIDVATSITPDGSSALAVGGATFQAVKILPTGSVDVGLGWQLSTLAHGPMLALGLASKGYPYGAGLLRFGIRANLSPYLFTDGEAAVDGHTWGWGFAPRVTVEF